MNFGVLLENRTKEPGPLQEKKTGAGAAPKKSGAGSAKNMRLLNRLLVDKKHKEIVHLVKNRTVEPEPDVLGFLEPEPLEKKLEEPLGKKVRSRSH